ncbi:MAG: hypothetical protein V3R25_05930 [Nitrosomonadaceae bacterium]
MKEYTKAALSHNRNELITEAEKNGVIIQHRKTNGIVVSELVMIPMDEYKKLTEGVKELTSVIEESLKGCNN